MTTSAITRSTTLRRAAALIAAIGWLALALQMLVTVTLTLRAEQSLPVALWRYAGYFTILTNVLMAMTMTRVARGRLVVASAREASTVTGVVLAIAIVGVVYEVLLSAVVPPMGPVWWTADRMLHYVVPTLAVLWGWCSCPRTRSACAIPCDGSPIPWPTSCMH